jgi:hypothetical protein
LKSSVLSLAFAIYEYLKSVVLLEKRRRIAPKRLPPVEYEEAAGGGLQGGRMGDEMRV